MLHKNEVRDLLPPAMLKALRILRYYPFRYLRYPLLRLLGYRAANPYYYMWDMFPREKMEGVLQSIFSELHVSKFDILLDHACGDGEHYTPVLQRFCRTIYGVDILDPASVRLLDRYFQVPTELKASYLDEIPDSSVNCVVMLASVGFTHRNEFKTCCLDKDSRMGRYLTPENYPRIVKAGGYIVIVEWESRPEKRVGRRNLEYVRKHIQEFYPPAEIPGWDAVLQGFADHFGPYIVYKRRLTQPEYVASGPDKANAPASSASLSASSHAALFGRALRDQPN